MSIQNNDQVNEPSAPYTKKSVAFFSSFEEMNEADAKENAAIASETHLKNASQRIAKIFSEDLQKPMDKKLKFKDGHSD